MTSDSPSKAREEIMAKLRTETERIVEKAIAAEKRQKETVAGITDPAIRKSIEEQRKRLI
jgi:hypothetical protein